MSMNVHPISPGGEPPAPDMVWIPGGTFHLGSEDGIVNLFVGMKSIAVLKKRKDAGEQ